MQFAGMSHGTRSAGSADLLPPIRRSADSTSHISPRARLNLKICEYKELQLFIV
jgi:hypothetical protein